MSMTTTTTEEHETMTLCSDLACHLDNAIDELWPEGAPVPMTAADWQRADDLAEEQSANCDMAHDDGEC